MTDRAKASHRDAVSRRRPTAGGAGRWTSTAAASLLTFVAGSASAVDVVEYYHTDAVGSVRVVTDASANVTERHDYLPFGEEWCGTVVCGSVSPGQPRLFTGKERDAETGLDYFGARYYRASHGRFTTVDPAHTAHDSLVDPQRWNKYAYASNNPLRFVDPDGRKVTGIRLVTSGPNAAGKSAELGKTDLGPAAKGRYFVYAVNIVVDVSADDSPDNYEPVQMAYVLYPKGQNTDPSRPGRSDSVEPDNPDSTRVTRTQNQLIWFDNPGVEIPVGVPPAGVEGTYLASFQSTVKPKRGTAGEPTDKVLNWMVRLDVKRGGTIEKAVAAEIDRFPLREGK